MSVRQSRTLIANRLAEADRAYQQELGRSFLLGSFKYLAIALILLFAIDLVFQLAAGHRVFGALAFAGALFLLLLLTFYRAFLKINRQEKIARILEERDPALGSKLINILQLQEDAGDPENSELTRSLAARAIDDASREVAGVSFPALVRSPERRKRDALSVLVTLVILAAIFGIFYPVASTEFRRFLDPHGDHPPYSFTRLEIVEPDAAGAQVTYKESIIIKVDHSGHAPREVFLSAFDPADPERRITTVPMIGKSGNGFVQQLDHITTDLLVYAHTRGDRSRSKQRRIHVLLTPKLEKAYLTVAPPAYTGLKPVKRDYDFSRIQALTGSKLTFTIRSNRPLRSGTIELGTSDGNREPGLIELLPGDVAPEIVTGSFPAEASARLRLSLVDIDGIPSDEEWTSSLTITHDLPPSVAISEPSQDSFVMESHQLRVVIDADDDYGLKKLRIHRALNGIFSHPKSLDYDDPRRAVRHAFTYDLPVLGVRPGDIISIFAEAVDSHPDQHLTASATRHFLIISDEEYNEYLRTQRDMRDLEIKYAELLDGLDDLIARQEEITRELGQLQEKPPGETGTAEAEATQNEIDRLLQEQDRINDDLREYAGRAENFVRDNPLYDLENELEKILQERAQAVRESVEQNQADTPRESGPQMLSQFKEAASEHLDRLAGNRQQAEEQIAQPLEDAAKFHEIVKDFNHFMQLYEIQEALTMRTQAYENRDDLSREDQLALQNLAAQERAVGEQLDQLAEKLFQDADAGEESFPQAARSARDLGHLMQAARMPQIARSGSQAMLEGDGKRSHQTAERLRQEMEKLFSQCQQGQGGLAGSLDSYLKLRQLSGGNTFQQMMQSRKFGFGSNGQGQESGFAQGMGFGGGNGSMMSASPNLGVIGGETSLDNQHRSQGQRGPSRDQSSIAASGEANDDGNLRQGDTSTTRRSGEIMPESILDQYRGLVEEYFRTITTVPPVSPPQKPE